jgi:putative pyruvate formate lyase activating enzyme
MFRSSFLGLPHPDPDWTVIGHVPAYLSLDMGEIEERAGRAVRLLGEDRCEVCPRLCRVGRLRDERALCGIGRQAVVASYFAHFGEENCLRGWNGSGTVFFSGCNLRCVFCQNYDISWEVRGERVDPDRLARMMLELQDMGCHNINWVTPEHVVPQILESLPAAIRGGLRLPIVYNTSAYDSLDSLELMEGIVDVYMPDLKYATGEASRRYSRRGDYAEVARGTIREMNRQVGPLRFDELGLARRGLLLRHLVMPGMLDETEAVLRFVADELGPDTYVDLMAQYYPAGLVGKGGRGGEAQFQEINRHLNREEYLEAVELGRSLGLRRLDARSVGSADRLARATR